MSARRGNIIWRPNCALDRRTLWCLWNSDKIMKHVGFSLVRSKETKGQKKNKRSFLVAECAHDSQRNTQFGLVMFRAFGPLLIKNAPPLPPFKSFDAIYG